MYGPAAPTLTPLVLSTTSSADCLPEFGPTLMSLEDETDGRVIAINNYGLKQFELPVTDSVGTLKYSPDELGNLVTDRRPLQQELELVPYADPGESVLFRPSTSSGNGDDLYRSLTAVKSGWEKCTTRFGDRRSILPPSLGGS